MTPPSLDPLQLRHWANSVAARFAAHVYLVGSCLQKQKPRDVDIRVVLTHELYEARYGTRGWIERHLLGSEEPSDGYLRWLADCAKLGEWASRYHGLNIDFQVQHEDEVEHFSYGDKPRIQLDDLDLSRCSADLA